MCSNSLFVHLAWVNIKFIFRDPNEAVIWILSELLGICITLRYFLNMNEGSNISELVFY